jgi:polyhydroxybutyrate depolymerase
MRIERGFAPIVGCLVLIWGCADNVDASSSSSPVAMGIAGAPSSSSSAMMPPPASAPPGAGATLMPVAMMPGAMPAATPPGAMTTPTMPGAMPTTPDTTMTPGDTGGAADGAAPAPPTCTDKTGLKPGDTEEMLMHDGMMRRYMLHVPASYDGTKGVPLVIDMHGWGGSAPNQAMISGWKEKGQKEGFIVVHPYSGTSDASWNGLDICCGQAMQMKLDDVGLMKAIAMTLMDSGCIDSKRIYGTGLSNGGAMSFALACDAADVFAATAPASMGGGAHKCMPARPISVIMFRGKSDNTVPYGGVNAAGYNLTGAEADFAEFKGINGCTGEPMMTHDGLCKTYYPCKAGTEVTLCSPASDHVLYSPAAMQGIAVPDVAWEAFKRQWLP